MGKDVVAVMITDDRNHPGLNKPTPSGQNEAYLVLSEEERSKGFVRPFRDTYRHLKCGSVTTMARPLAETYARNPKFYGATFCVGCGTHNPVAEFVWDGTNQEVGS
jgi:hypothetical protein